MGGPDSDTRDTIVLRSSRTKGGSETSSNQGAVVYSTRLPVVHTGWVYSRPTRSPPTRGRSTKGNTPSDTLAQSVFVNSGCGTPSGPPHVSTGSHFSGLGLVLYLPHRPDRGPTYGLD